MVASFDQTHDHGPRPWLVLLLCALYAFAGLTGHDWIMENGADVQEVAELVFSKVSRRPVRCRMFASSVAADGYTCSQAGR